MAQWTHKCVWVCEREDWICVTATGSQPVSQSAEQESQRYPEPVTTVVLLHLSCEGPTAPKVMSCCCSARWCILVMQHLLSVTHTCQSRGHTSHQQNPKPTNTATTKHAVQYTQHEEPSKVRRWDRRIPNHTLSLPDDDGGGAAGTMPVLVYQTMPPMAHATPINFFIVIVSPKNTMPLVTMNTVLRWPTTL